MAICRLNRHLLGAQIVNAVLAKRAKLHRLYKGTSHCTYDGVSVPDVPTKRNSQMEVIIGLLILWAFITLIGHGSWVLIASFIRLFKPAKTTAREEFDQQRSDITAAHRVLNRLISNGVVDLERGRRLRNDLRVLEYPERMRKLADAASTKPFDQSEPVIAEIVQQPEPPSPISPRPESPADRKLPTLAPTRPAPHTPTSEIKRATPAGESEDVIVADVVAEPFDQGASEDVPVAKPALSRSEIIRSFLAAKNIRWGELVAGILIVVCSIGLVISLWQTLKDTHRVIPSLIFLAANGAIFSAGLYTLSRWRLRHTSRAVLVIAILLVPLSVLAGIAAAGSESSVILSDPITLLAIFGGGAVYLGLLWRGSRALVGRAHAIPLTLAVAGSASLLPFLPATIRAVGDQAAWIVGGGAIALFASSIWMALRTSEKRSKLTVVASRSRMLLMGLGTFALCVLVGYAVFAINDADQGNWQLATSLPIAITVIPAVLALAGTGRLLMLDAERSSHSMMGASICCISVGLLATMLPAMMQSMGWVWTWAATVALFGATLGLVLRQPRWLPAATIPLGVAALFSSPTLISGLDWSTLPFWRRIFGGEPMVAALAVSAGAFGMSRIARDELSRRWLSIGACIWTGVAVVIASCLSLSSTDLLGAVPASVVTGVLLVGAIGSAVASFHEKRLSPATIAAVALAWVSVFRPITLSLPFEVQSASWWTLTGLLISATLMPLAEVALAVRRRSPAYSDCARTNALTWSMGATMFALAAVVPAAILIPDDWSWASIAFASIAALLFWASTCVNHKTLLGLSQLATLATAAIVVQEKLGSSGLEPWTFALMGFASVAIWYAMRELSTLVGRRSESTAERLSLLQPEHTPSFSLVDGIALLGATVITLGTVAWAYLSLIAQSIPGLELGVHTGMVMPLVCFALAIGLAFWSRRHAGESGQSVVDGLLSALTTGIVVWVSWQLSRAFVSGAVEQLVATTTITIGIGVLLSRFAMPHLLRTDGWAVELPSVVSLALVCMSSIALLGFEWLEPILDGRKPDQFATLSIASWWLAAAAGLLWSGRSRQSQARYALSSFFAPAAVGLVAPLFAESPLVAGIQWTAIAASAWAALVWWTKSDDADQIATFTVRSLLQVTIATGVVSALLAIGCILFNAPTLQIIFGSASAIVSVLAVVVWCGLASRVGLRSLPWPVGVSILAGQIAWIGLAIGMIAPIDAIQVMVIVWLAASISSMVRFSLNSDEFDFWHAVIGCFGVGMLSAFLAENGYAHATWFGLAGCVAGGLFVAVVNRGFPIAVRHSVACRVLGWFVVVLGGGLIMQQGSGSDEVLIWTLLVLWASTWLVTWRAICPDQIGLEHGKRRQGVPETELATVLLLGVFAEFLFAVTVIGEEFDYATMATDALGWLRIACWLIVAASAVLRTSRIGVWQVSIATLVTTIGFVVARFGIESGANWGQRVALAGLSSGFVLAVIALWLPNISMLTASLGAIRTNETLSQDFVRTQQLRMVDATTHLVLFVAGVLVLAACVMIAASVQSTTIYLTVGGLLLTAWAMSELADVTSNTSARHLTVSMGLVSLGLFATVGSGHESHPVLLASMRWFITSVITTGMIAFVLPKLLGESVGKKWSAALRRGGFVTAVTAVGSLIVMLCIEAVVRNGDGIDTLARPTIVAVAIMLSVLCLICALMAIMSGPGFKYRDVWKLSDGQRRILVVGAQAIGFLTWLHLFLCKTDWAFVGLRAYWPYIVMGLAFISVGATEWARRRRDELMAATLKQTALFLPIIPVVGFWLSGLATDWGPFEQWTWNFIGDKVPYELLLTLGAVYYAILSAMWRGAGTRVAAIVLGNAALWAVLVQSPGWGFLEHPQLWVIPPAVCVLVTAHLYRARLDKSLAMGIRYAATLVIYISSTADMLIQDIGSTISGPIILIVLALLGMAMGVILKVRPFLYLGVIFVLIGVTSMVFHAQQQIDAVWPWWVFGITTGIALLTALTMIEKNKPKLRQYADTLASWEA